MKRVLILVAAALAFTAMPAVADHYYHCHHDRWGNYDCHNHYTSSSSYYYSRPVYSSGYSRDPYYYDSYYDRGYYRRSRSNDLVGTAVGIGVANELFNRGSSRDDIRKGAIGAAVLGSLIR